MALFLGSHTKKICFNRPLGIKDLWGLRNVILAIITRMFRPKIIINVFYFLCGNVLRFGKVANRPLYAVLEPSSRCNLKCKMCRRTLYQLNRPESDMSYSQFKSIIDQIGDYLIFVALWNYGEPLLNPNIHKMVDYCSRKGIITGISTNGILLTRERSLSLITSGLKYLIVSVDGTSDEVYQNYREPARLAEIENNVRQICGLKKDNKSKFPIIEAQFIVMSGNEHQVDDFFPMVRSWGVDRASLKKFSLFRDSSFLKDFIPCDKHYILDCFKKNSQIHKRSCSTPWQALVINSDGSVVPCCDDFFSLKKMGNAFAMDINKIWNSDSYVDFRRKIKQDINSLNICYFCIHNQGHCGSFISTKQFLL